MTRPIDSTKGQILIFCPIGLGNFIMALPALKALSSAAPGRLSLLALKPSIASMAQGSGLFAQIFSWDPDREGLGRGLALLRAVRAQRFAHSLALFPASHWKFSAFQLLAGASHRLGFAYPHQRLPARAQHVSLPLENAHDTVQNRRLVEAFLGRNVGETGAPFFPLAPVQPEGGIPKEPYVVCHPGSSAERGMAEKRLPPETFAALLGRCHRELSLRCVLVGGPEEAGLRAAVASRCGEAIVDVPAKSLEQTAALLQGARLFLGNDSGLMHVAAALGTPCAAFFGPTDERRNGPFGYWENRNGFPRHLILRRTDLDCSPCWTWRTIGANPPCIYGDTRCLRAFGADAIWEKLREWIAGLNRSAAE